VSQVLAKVIATEHRFQAGAQGIGKVFLSQMIWSDLKIVKLQGAQVSAVKQPGVSGNVAEAGRQIA
jgi:hypothetical protein